MDFEIFTHYSGRMPQDFHQRSLNGVALVHVNDMESDRIWHMFVYIYIHIILYLYIHTYVRTYVHTYICIYSYIYFYHMLVCYFMMFYFLCFGKFDNI
jgi:hypothetical protein